VQRANSVTEKRYLLARLAFYDVDCLNLGRYAARMVSNQIQSTAIPTLFSKDGKRITVIPKPMTGEFCRTSYYKTEGTATFVHDQGEEKHPGLIRAQVPHLVTLLVYHSPLQLRAEHREYYVYAPQDFKSAVLLARSLWNKWESHIGHRVLPGPHGLGVEVYPRIDDGSVAEPIDDKFFAEMLKQCDTHEHKKAGDPRDPLAFTILGDDVKIYRTGDFQSGLSVRV